MTTFQEGMFAAMQAANQPTTSPTIAQPVNQQYKSITGGAYTPDQVSVEALEYWKNRDAQKGYTNTPVDSYVSQDMFSQIDPASQQWLIQNGYNAPSAATSTTPARGGILSIGDFDATAYLRANQDVALNGMSPYQHYTTYGINEGRSLGDSTRPVGNNVELGDTTGAVSVDNFDAAAYLRANPDVVANGMDPYLHYINYGRAEGRSLGDVTRPGAIGMLTANTITGTSTGTPTGLLTPQSNTTRNGNLYSGFDPGTDTTRGQVNSMLQQDSEYLQNARTQAKQSANNSGILNSSMTDTAATKAAIDAAALIGDATANQYQKSKLTTQELNSRMDLANLDADTRMRIAQIDSAYKDKALASGDRQSSLSNYRAIADSTNQMIQTILVSPNLTPEAKQQAINYALARHDEYINFQDGITGYNLSDMITYEGA